MFMKTKETHLEKTSHLLFMNISIKLMNICQLLLAKTNNFSLQSLVQCTNYLNTTRNSSTLIKTHVL